MAFLHSLSVTGIVAKSVPPIGSALVEELLRRVLGQTADAVLREALLRVLRPTAAAGAEDVARSLGIRPSVDAGHPALARLVSDRLPRIVGVNETTRARIRSALLRVLTEGGDLDEQRKAVRDVFGDASKRRAIMIARTEAGIFWHSAGRTQADEGGARSHVWISTRDARVREAHADAEGQCQPIDRAYNVGGEPLRYPLDPQGSPGNVINCRCTEAFQVTECEGRALSFAARTWLWKRQQATLGAWERLALGTTRRVFATQLAAALEELRRFSGES